MNDPSGASKVGGTGGVSGTGGTPVRTERFTRRNLPHWQRQGAIYFLTWRCAPGIVLTEDERDVVMSAIRHWDGRRWRVYAAVVMPDHVHVLAQPLAKADGVWDLSELLHSVKSYSAHKIAKRKTAGPNGRPVGQIWQDERYDRWVRDEEEFAEKWQYIANNPVKSGLVANPHEYRWLYLSERFPD